MSLEGQNTQKLVRNLWDDADIIGGGDPSFGRGVCVMQAVDYVAGSGSEFNVSDHPRCVDYNLSDYFIRLNDATRVKVQRNRIRPFIPRLIGTVREDSLSPHLRNQYDHAPEGVNYAQILFEEQDIEIKRLLGCMEVTDYSTRNQLFDYERWTKSNTAGLSRKLRSGQRLHRFLLAQQQGVHYESIDLTPILKLLDRVLPPAKEYKLVAGQKVNVIARVQKLVSRIRAKSGKTTEWEHETGIAEIVELS